MPDKKKKSLKELSEEQRKADAVKKARTKADAAAKAKADAAAKAKPKKEALSPFNEAIRKLKKKVREELEKTKKRVVKPKPKPKPKPKEKKDKHELDRRMRKQLKEAGYSDEDVESLMRPKKK